MSKSKKTRKPRKKRGFFRRFIRWIFLIIVGFYIYCILGLVYLRFLPPLYTSVQIQHRIERIFSGESPLITSQYRSLEELSRHIPHAVVAAEDTRFYEHSGVDWEAIEDALGEGREQTRGGSTISQQLVKNLFFTTHRSYTRKALELTLTPVAELILGKDRILELYVNIAEWGPGIYGAEAAARYHYGISGDQVSRTQAARLAACLPSPRTRRPERMRSYGNIILSRMRILGY